MKRFFVPLTIFIFALAAVGQDTASQSPAAELAAKQSADERYDRMAADIQALQAANDALQQNLTRSCNNSQTCTANFPGPSHFATTDDLKRWLKKSGSGPEARRRQRQHLRRNPQINLRLETRAGRKRSACPRFRPAAQSRPPNPLKTIKGSFTKFRTATAFPRLSKPTTPISKARA